MCYVDSHNLLPANQSAYRNFHSTETALLKVFNDILLAVDKGDEAVLLLLDFSAAFDTLDHTVLLQRLAKDYSITGTVLQWIESYLQDRTQKVIINVTCSAPSILSCGVPQGSVIGPLLFLLYTGPLAKIITSHQGVNYAMYADDTQIHSTNTLLFKNTLKTSANQLLGVSSELVSSGDSSTKPQLKDLFTPSSPPIWTIVTPSLLASLFLIFLHSSVFKIQQLEWLL